MKNNFAQINKYCQFIIILSFLGYFGTSISRAADNSHDIALALNISGKAGLNKCDSFARDLFQRINNAGGEATYVVYDWVDENRSSGRHAFIVYRDSKGNYWGMDNVRHNPKWLDGKTPAEWVQNFASGVESRLVYAHTNVWLVGCYADFEHAAQVPTEERSNAIALYMPNTGRTIP